MRKRHDLPVTKYRNMDVSLLRNLVCHCEAEGRGNPDAKGLGLDMKLLSNAPLGEDLFEGKSQELIADAIIEQLEQNANQREPDLHHQMIGIEGSWGSGKSNLVEIVKKKLNKKYETKKYHFFIYDVWGHQEDLQRKAILEELVNDLVENKVIVTSAEKNHDHNWKERVRNVTGTFTETTQRQIPSISLGFALCVLALIITPICANISDDSIWANVAPWLPPATVLLALVFFIIRKGLKRGFAEFIYSYKGKCIESTEKEFVHEKNPSVIDFRSLLYDLSNALTGRHLIIFFDNMDRLPKQKVERLWSSIHTFFAENHGYDNISCIITFDREHIQEAFSAKGDNNRGTDYIDKTFDVVFRVAPPVLADWKIFFEKKWKEAFEDKFNPIEYEYVIQAYDILSKHSDLSPRSIIRFINECVLLKMTFNNIPERYIAIFNLRKDDLVSEPLNKATLNNLQSIYEHDPKYHDYITALVYLVPPEKAISVIYKQALSMALEQGDEKTLNNIGQAPFFKEILEDALKSFANLRNPITSLDKMNFIPLSEEQIKKLWRDLYFRSVQSMQFDSGKIEQFQIALLKHLESDLKKELIQKILSPFNNIDFSKPRNIYGENRKEYTPEEYVEVLKRMEKAVQRDELKEFLQKPPIDAVSYKILLHEFNDINWIPFEHTVKIST